MCIFVLLMVHIFLPCPVALLGWQSWRWRSWWGHFCHFLIPWKCIPWNKVLNILPFTFQSTMYACVHLLFEGQVWVYFLSPEISESETSRPFKEGCVLHLTRVSALANIFTIVYQDQNIKDSVFKVCGGSKLGPGRAGSVWYLSAQHSFL